jgi:O-antigen/teichoic acid export membrane protein
LAVVLNLLIKTAWILANNIVQDRIGHSEFGLYLALYAFGFLFLALSDMGLNQYSTKTLASQPELLKRLFPTMFSLKAVLALIYPPFMVGAGWLVGYRGQELYFLLVLSGVHALLQMNAFFRANFQAFQQFRFDAFASVLDRSLMLLIVTAMLLTKLDLEGYIWAYFASAALSMVVLYLFMVKMFGRMRAGWDIASMRQLLVASFPFAVITILYSINDKVDQVMLERMLGPMNGKHETGLYGGAYRWVDTVMMYLWTVLPIFFAKFAHHIKEEKQLSKLLAFGQPIATLPMLFAGVFGLIYGDKLLFLFKNSSPAELETMTYCLKALFLSVLVNGFFAIYSTLLTATGHEKFVSWMIGISIGINVGLNIAFIPLYGAVAAAWTTFVCYSFLSISYLFYIQFKLPVKIPYGNLLKLLAVGAVFGGGYWALAQTSLDWWLVTGISGIGLLGLAYFSGLLKLKNIDG